MVDKLKQAVQGLIEEQEAYKAQVDYLKDRLIRRTNEIADLLHSYLKEISYQTPPPTTKEALALQKQAEAVLRHATTISTDHLDNPALADRLQQVANDAASLVSKLTDYI